jgi:homoserine dehydrogenase
VGLPGYHAPMAGQGGSRGRRLRVAVLGAGAVGREVVGALMSDGFDDRFDVAGVAVRDIEKAKARGLPAELLTDAPAHLVTDHVDVVVELMGGEEPARTIVSAALGAGLPVVTANKFLLARHGASLEAAARATETPLRYEAAVLGGTPVLRLLAEDLAGCRVASFRGIVNGTSNFILSAMATGGLSYERALEQAQAAGYAEADPTADVEGGDAADKLVIVARLAFGAWLDRGELAVRFGEGRPGITGVTAEDLVTAADHGLAMKLLATAERADEADGDGAGATSVMASVRPTAVDAMSPLASTAGVRNRIDIQTDRLGWISLEGPGAGGRATASAVLADLAAVYARRGSTWGSMPPAGTAVSRAADPASVFDGPSGARYPILR